MKQTAVEWLANEFYEKLEVKGDGALFNDLVDQAKEMEKQQIIDAFNVGFKDRGLSFLQGEQYYNKTFKNK
jgi:Ni,Fe-hydrogenase maturation factor